MIKEWIDHLDLKTARELGYKDCYDANGHLVIRDMCRLMAITSERSEINRLIAKVDSLEKLINAEKA